MGAQRAFARHGYDGATVAKIEEETGLSRGAIFNYFGSKQDLFVELAVGVSRRYGRSDRRDGIEAAVRAMAAEDPAWLGVLLEAQARLRHDPEFVRKLEAAYETAAPPLGRWFEARQADGTFRDDVERRRPRPFRVDRDQRLRTARRSAATRPTSTRSLCLLHDTLAPRK